MAPDRWPALPIENHIVCALILHIIFTVLSVCDILTVFSRRFLGVLCWFMKSQIRAI